MKFFFVLSTLFTLSLLPLMAQNTVPNDAVLVPGTLQLYTTQTDEVSKMMRNAAVSACLTRGDGWRLPTLGELQIMYSHRFEMDFGEGRYWSDDKVRGKFAFYALNFKNGKTIRRKYDKEFFVRCVWTPQDAKKTLSSPL